MEDVKIREQDLIDLMVCGSVYLNGNKKLFYALKDKILETYGMPYCYELQSWYDMDNWGNDEYEDVFAGHHHILKAYYLSTQDGRYISCKFHIPTNEFYYWNENGVRNKSEHFDELRKKVFVEFEGKKKHGFGRNEMEAGWSALKRLVRRYGFLLRQLKEKVKYVKSSRV